MVLRLSCLIPERVFLSTRFTWLLIKKRLNRLTPVKKGGVPWTRLSGKSRHVTMYVSYGGGAGRDSQEGHKVSLCCVWDGRGRWEVRRRLSIAQLAGLFDHFIICKYHFQNFLCIVLKHSISLTSQKSHQVRITVSNSQLSKP